LNIFFEKFAEKIRVSLKSDKNNGYFLIICRSILLRMRNFSNKIV